MLQELRSGKNSHMLSSTLLGIGVRQVIKITGLTIPRVAGPPKFY